MLKKTSLQTIKNSTKALERYDQDKRQEEYSLVQKKQKWERLQAQQKTRMDNFRLMQRQQIEKESQKEQEKRWARQQNMYDHLAEIQHRESSKAQARKNMQERQADLAAKQSMQEQQQKLKHILDQADKRQAEAISYEDQENQVVFRHRFEQINSEMAKNQEQYLHNVMGPTIIKEKLQEAKILHDYYEQQKNQEQVEDLRKNARRQRNVQAMNDNYDLMLEKRFYTDQLQRFKNSDSAQLKS